MENNLEKILPDTIEGWEIDRQDQIYGPDNLYEYINGGAELFLSYDFKQVITRVYSAPDQPEIIVDIFDMANSYNAYGIFSYSREKEEQTLGQGSQYVTGLLLFWKDRYYISVLFNPETEEAKETAFKIARHIEAGIQNIGSLPEILDILPQPSLQRESIRYFRHHIWMNTYQFISNDNILNINDSAHAVLAKYGGKDDARLLLLIQYPNEKKASIAQHQFRSAYLPQASESDLVKKGNKWIGCRKHFNLLIIVFNAQKKEFTEEIIRQITQR